MKILLDPGHGGGSTHNRGFVKIDGFDYCNEGDCNFFYAQQYLKPELEKYGIEVLMTRKNINENPSLAQRGQMGKGCDLLISLHSNAANGKAHGIEIWDSTNPKESIKELCNNLCNEISMVTGIFNRGTKYKKGSSGGNFYGILRNGLAKHNFIIEHAFHDNYNDCIKYVKNLPKIAETTARVIANYFKLNKVGYSSDTPIIGPATATLGQVEAWAKSKSDNSEFISLAQIYFNVFNRLGLDPVVGYAQMAHETGFLYKVKSAAGLDLSYYNPCGLKITQGGGDYQSSAHKRFASWEEGITAQADHLALYAGHKGYPKSNTPDPRHFTYLLGKAKTVMALGGKWAPSKEYGKKIMKYIEEIKSMDKTNSISIDNSPSDWAEEAWNWGIEKGITDGTNPKSSCTREQVITMLYRAKELNNG